MSPGVPGGDITRLLFKSQDDLDNLLALVSGQGVELAGGLVEPATRSGLPRLMGNLLRLYTVLAYAQCHSKPPLSGSGRTPSKYSMVYWADAERTQRGWWTDVRNWPTMWAIMWPDHPIPDYER
jgi:hypothetical protein